MSKPFSSWQKNSRQSDMYVCCVHLQQLSCLSRWRSSLTDRQTPMRTARPGFQDWGRGHPPLRLGQKASCPASAMALQTECAQDSEIWCLLISLLYGNGYTCKQCSCNCNLVLKKHQGPSWFGENSKCNLPSKGKGYLSSSDYEFLTILRDPERWPGWAEWRSLACCYLQPAQTRRPSGRRRGGWWRSSRGRCAGAAGLCAPAASGEPAMCPGGRGTPASARRRRPCPPQRRASRPTATGEERFSATLKKYNWEISPSLVKQAFWPEKGDDAVH